MKNKNVILFLMVILQAVPFVAMFEGGCFDELSEYSNQIVSIHEVSNRNKMSSVFSFEQAGPICTYTPRSFKEHKEQKIHRYSMPYTTIADGVTSSLDLEEFEEGVELALYGSSVDKLSSNNRITFVVQAT